MPKPRWIDGLRISSPLDTLVDLAATAEPRRLERLVDEAARRRLIDLDAARVEARAIRRQGARTLEQVLTGADRTDSDLEDLFLSLIRGARLPEPLTQQTLLGFRVDFLWPDLSLVVETDGLAFHQTRQQQATDRVRDQRLTAAGFTCLRFTNDQVRRRPGSVLATMRGVIRRLG